jgi:hypothetical protein
MCVFVFPPWPLSSADAPGPHTLHPQHHHHPQHHAQQQATQDRPPASTALLVRCCLAPVGARFDAAVAQRVTRALGIILGTDTDAARAGAPAASAAPAVAESEAGDDGAAPGKGGGHGHHHQHHHSAGSGAVSVAGAAAGAQSAPPPPPPATTLDVAATLPLVQAWLPTAAAAPRAGWVCVEVAGVDMRLQHTTPFPVGHTVVTPTPPKLALVGSAGERSLCVGGGRCAGAMLLSFFESVASPPCFFSRV